MAAGVAALPWIIIGFPVLTVIYARKGRAAQDGEQLQLQLQASKKHR
jgi:hypothetical protein